MKQVVLIIGLCLATTTAFAQKASVTGAERISRNSRGNFNEARSLINGALEHADTKDDPKTWFIAGQVEDAQFNAENTKQILGQQPNEPVMYEALQNGIPFYMQAYELDQRPDARGRVRPKYDKNIKGIFGANHIYFLHGGIYYYEQEEYQKAYDLWDKYVEIANLPFMSDTKAAAKDENYFTAQFYAGIAATFLENKELAIKAFTRAKDAPFRQNDAYQFLIWEYEQLRDTANLEKLYEECMNVFPDSSYYMFSLISIYLLTDRDAKALEMLNMAMSKDATNAQLYYAIGSVYESSQSLGDIEKAESNYAKALEIDPDDAINHSNLGRIYFNQAANKLNEANQITDVNEYNVEKAVARGLFEKARPYYEKAHQLNPDEKENIMALRGIYYNLEMDDEFEAIEAKMNINYDE